MKIAILTPLKEGKAETFIQNHISKLPFEKVVVYGGDFPYLTEKQQPSAWQKTTFELQQLIKKKLGTTTQDFKSFRLLKILRKEKVDAVFAEYLITGAEVMEACKKLNIPLFSIALGHDISRYHIIKVYGEKYRNLFQYATNIFVVSKHMRENLLALDCPPAKIIYSPIGPTNEFFEIQPSFNKIQVFALGRFVDKKAPHLTILAFQKVLKEIPEAKLIMGGDGVLLSACEDLVMSLKIQKSVQFVGKISRTEHQRLLKESFLFVQHSKTANNGNSEGTPVAILEASAAGLPIVSTIHAGIKDVVINGETGFLVPENDVELMAKKIIEILENKMKAIKFGKNGRIYIKENFSLKRHIEIIEKQIKSVQT